MIAGKKVTGVLVSITIPGKGIQHGLNSYPTTPQLQIEAILREAGVELHYCDTKLGWGMTNQDWIQCEFKPEEFETNTNGWCYPKRLTPASESKWMRLFESGQLVMMVDEIIETIDIKTEYIGHH